MSDPSTFEPAAHQEGETACLFRCAETGRYAVSQDRSGQNLPASGSPQGWEYIQDMVVGVRDPLPVPGDPEPILRGLYATGYYIWADGINPRGTSQ